MSTKPFHDWQLEATSQARGVGFQYDVDRLYHLNNLFQGRPLPGSPILSRSTIQGLVDVVREAYILICMRIIRFLLLDRLERFHCLQIPTDISVKIGRFKQVLNTLKGRYGRERCRAAGEFQVTSLKPLGVVNSASKVFQGRAVHTNGSVHRQAWWNVVLGFGYGRVRKDATDRISSSALLSDDLEFTTSQNALLPDETSCYIINGMKLQ